MRRHRIPDTDLEVSALCFGTGAFGTEIKGAQADALVRDFVAAGGNFFDTAHVYGGWIKDGTGVSERELGDSLQRLGIKDSVVVATKGGHPNFGDFYPRPDAYLSPAVISSDITDSLNHLGIERIDLYFLHRDDPRVPAEEIVEMMNSEIVKGRIRYFGASNWSVARLAAANAYAQQKGLAGFVASEIQWSLAEPTWRPEADPTPRFVTDEEVAWHKATSVPIVAYSAAANGFFADPARGNNLYDSALNRGRRERTIQIADRIGCTPTQIALAYLMYQPSLCVIPLFSTANPEHLTEALASVNVTLSPEQVAWLRSEASNSE